MQQLSTLNTTGPIDYDNLNIIIHPRPPRRRQSGISLVPFRPYVKCLTSVREPFSFANGKDSWTITGRRETFFKQENARCIGSLIDDCDISDVIRWDIAGDSTRLPMMCKLWIIVDGAVVERGKPHLVQDAAIQVCISGRNRRSILSGERRYNQTLISTFDRRRRHSWHDVNEYHSVPYYQYTRSVRLGHQQSIQCDLDNEHSTSKQEFLPFLKEETVDENQFLHMIKHNAQEIIHNHPRLQDRVQISIMTQTEHEYVNQSTSIDPEFILLYNLNLQTNENILSSIVNPYNNDSSSNSFWSRTSSTFRSGKQYINRSISTGDDYPQWWLQLSTNIILSDRITNQGENKEKILFLSSPRQQNQSIQTDIELEKLRPSSARIQKSSSSLTINDHYEIIDEIDDGNNSRRILPFIDRQRVDSHNDLDSHLSDNLIEISSNRLHRTTSSSKQSDSDYHTLTLPLNQQSYSTSDSNNIHTSCDLFSNNEITPRIQTKITENTSTLLSTLLERYERTLRERQRAIAIVNDELLDIDNLLKPYREKIQNSIPPPSSQSDRTIELYQDISNESSQSKEDYPSSSRSITHLTKDKYRSMENITSEEMLEGYVPSPRLVIKNSILNSPRQRSPRYDYCDLCLTNHETGSAWIRYNEQRIDQLQKRIDLMLQIDDHEEAQLFFSTYTPITNTVTQRIDDILMKRAKRRNHLTYYHDRILSPRRYNFRLPYRLNRSLPNTPRLTTPIVTRATTPTSKSVRISTDHDLIPNSIDFSDQTSLKSVSRPIVSILRRNHTTLSPRSRRLVEASHIWKSDSDGKIYILEQFSIPRYYRLYNDVSFREVYHFSRILQSYTKGNQLNSNDYSSFIKNFALEQQLPTITSVA